MIRELFAACMNISQLLCAWMERGHLDSHKGWLCWVISRRMQPLAGYLVLVNQLVVWVRLRNTSCITFLIMLVACGENSTISYLMGEQSFYWCAIDISTMVNWVPSLSIYIYEGHKTTHTGSAKSVQPSQSANETLTLPIIGPQWTSTHQCTIHWMPVITQLWMNLNWVNIWFHLVPNYLGNRSYI
jgi:hypothetical protein